MPLTKKALVAASLIIFLFFGLFPVSSTALSPEQKALFDSNILYYDLGSCVDINIDVSLSGSNNVERAMNFFVNSGFSPEQAGGILGNFIQESGVNPSRVEDGWGFPRESNTVPPASGPQGQPGYGIAQWTSPGRKVNLKNFAKDNNKPENSLALQLEFVLYEMDRSFPSLAGELKNIKDDEVIKNTAFLFHKIYEGSADSFDQIQERADSGKEAFAIYSGSVLLGTSDSSPGETAPGCGETHQNSFSTIDYKNKQELIQRVLDSKNITLQTAAENKDLKNCITETTLIGLVGAAEQSGANNIIVTDFAEGHDGCDGGDSLHNYGQAIDIGYFGNGELDHTLEGDKVYNYFYDNRDSLKIDELIWKKPPSGKKCLESGNIVDCRAVYKGDYAAHNNHIHVGFKE